MAKQTKKATRKAGQGSNWIWRPTRLRLYARDGHRCVYCGADVADPRVTLSLDHVTPVDLGGDNDPSNLVTACVSCNSAKRNLALSDFLAYLADRGIDPDSVRKAIRNAVRRKLPKLGK